MQQVTINEFVVRFLDEMRRVGYVEETIYRVHIRRIRRIARFYELSGTVFYSIEKTNEYVRLMEERCEKGEIEGTMVRGTKATAHRMNEFFITGTLTIQAWKHGTVFTISAENEALIDRFIEWKNYGRSTSDDVRWIVRKYLFYFEQKGHSDLKDVGVEEVRDFILKTAMELKAASLHNLLLYLKYFHLFLKEQGLPSPDCVDLFSYRVYREMPIQSYVTDEEFDRITAVIDRDTVSGKRDYAMIQLAATTGLRAIDIINIRLSDIDWRRKEISIIQKKTGKPIVVPLIPSAAAAVSDYILNARPKSDYSEVFLRLAPPFYAIMDTSSIGDMFKRYQEKAGLTRQPFDGKGFHGLRRRLAKKLLVAGTPTTSIAQILGHNDVNSVRQYLSLDTSNLKECALGLDEIPVIRKELA